MGQNVPLCDSPYSLPHLIVARLLDPVLQYELFSQNISDSMEIQGISLKSFPCYFFQNEMKFSLLKSCICVSQNMCCDG